jgi:hypothetical protein
MFYLRYLCLFVHSGVQHMYLMKRHSNRFQGSRPCYSATISYVISLSNIYYFYDNK